ncbi:Gamma-tubulin complex component 3, partial [Armadillidium nasatum]
FADFLFELNNFATNTLNNFESAEASPDYSLCSDNIKRWLIHENRLEEFGQISLLLDKLLKSKVLQNKPAILNMLFCLRHNGISDSINKELPSALSAEFSPTTLNGLHNISNFVYCNKMSNSNFERKKFGKTRPSTEVDITKEENEKICGRVARLAALYKVHDFKESIDENINSFKQSKRGTNIRSPSQISLGKSEVVFEKCSLYTDVSENDLIREILFSFQGIEGKIIKNDVINDCFKLDHKIRLSVGQRDLVNKLIEIGCLYNIINRFCEANCRNFGGRSIQKNFPNNVHLINSAGLVNQSLILAVKEELNEYCRLIAVLESQLQETSSKFSKDASIEGLTLRRLLLWTLEPRCRLQTLALIIHSVRDFKGGASASALYQHLHHGDNSHVEVVRHALSQACRPLFVMLTEWLLDGNLQDPHHEFFIAADSSVPNERMWHDKYTLRKCMLPSFISLKQAQKVLATGKSLNFLRHVCNFKSAIGDRDLIQTAVGKTSGTF